MKISHSLCTISTILAFPLMAETSQKIEVTETDDVAVGTAKVSEQTDKVVVTEAATKPETLQEKIQRLEKEIGAKKSNVETLRKELEKTREESETKSLGNANHAKDLIDAEADVILKHLERASSRIEELRESHTEKAMKDAEEGKVFAYEDKMKVVNAFLDKSQQTITKLNEAFTLDKPEEDAEAIRKELSES